VCDHAFLVYSPPLYSLLQYLVPTWKERPADGSTYAMVMWLVPFPFMGFEVSCASLMRMAQGALDLDA
jgi:hypothetical protein